MSERTEPKRRNPDRLESLSRMPAALLERRARSFQTALNRKGLPMTWGKGDKERQDKAWRR